MSSQSRKPLTRLFCTRVSLRAALIPCHLADPVAAPSPTLAPSSSQDVALPPCKARAPFCKAQRVRSKIRILNKSKKYVGIAWSVIIFAPRHVCSESMRYIMISNYFLRKDYLSAFCTRRKMQNVEIFLLL